MKSEAKSTTKAPAPPSLPTPVPVLGEDQLTISEMENVTTVFRYFETGLREATILPKVQKRTLAMLTYFNLLYKTNNLILLVLVLVQVTINAIIKPSCPLPLRGNMSPRAKCIRKSQPILRKCFITSILPRSE